jgi:catechol 2,3-dioxygenase-like lactoylglutathione lyase family enzyme
MNRFHVHLSVADFDRSVAFYTALFGQPPTRRESGYAKWMLEDPRLNFAIAQQGREPGIDHLGIQVDSSAELDALTTALRQAELAVAEQHAAECCYARSDKGWVRDPQGVVWETFVTFGESTVYGPDRDIPGRGSCCAPAA